MKANISPNETVLELNDSEVSIIENALSEVRKRIKVYEFSTRLGGTHEDAMLILKKLSDTRNEYSPANSEMIATVKLETTPESTFLKVNFDELYLMKNALNEVSNGIRIYDFKTTMGATPAAVHLLLKEFSNANKQYLAVMDGKTS